MVTMGLPAAAEKGVRHDRTALPSSSTVHAPHWPSPHPYFVPVSCSLSRRTQSSGSSEGALTCCSFPFTIRTDMLASRERFHYRSVTRPSRVAGYLGNRAYRHTTSEIGR